MRLPSASGAGAQIRPFRHRLLHAILAEHELAAVADRRPDLVGGKRLGDGDQRDLLRLAIAIARAPRDRLAQRFEPRHRRVRRDIHGLASA